MGSFDRLRGDLTPEAGSHLFLWNFIENQWCIATKNPQERDSSKIGISNFRDESCTIFYHKRHRRRSCRHPIRAQISGHTHKKPISSSNLSLPSNVAIFPQSIRLYLGKSRSSETVTVIEMLKTCQRGLF